MALPFDHLFGVPLDSAAAWTGASLPALEQLEGPAADELALQAQDTSWAEALPELEADSSGAFDSGAEAALSSAAEAEASASHHTAADHSYQSDHSLLDAQMMVWQAQHEANMYTIAHIGLRPNEYVVIERR